MTPDTWARREWRVFCAVLTVQWIILAGIVLAGLTW